MYPSSASLLVSPARRRALDADDRAAPRVAYRLRQPVVALGVGPEAPAPDLPPEAVEQAQDMHVLVRVDARDDRFAFHFRSPRSAACPAPGPPRHCTDGSATIKLACPIVRAHAPIRSWQDSGSRKPGRDRSDLRTAEEASAGQWVIVPAFSIRVALRRGNRAPLTRPRSARFPREQLSVQVQGLDISGVLGLFRFCRILPKIDLIRGGSEAIYATYVQQNGW